MKESEMSDYLLFNAFTDTTSIVTGPIRMGDMTQLRISVLVVSGTTSTASGTSVPPAVVVEQSNDGNSWTLQGVSQPTATSFDGKVGPSFCQGSATTITMRLARIRLTGIGTGVILNVSAAPYRT